MNKDESVDADFALRLEQLHDRLKSEGVGNLDRLQVDGDLNVRQALDALVLIQQLKQDQQDAPASPEVSFDTHRSIDTQVEPLIAADYPIDFEGQHVGRFELVELIGRGGYRDVIGNDGSCARGGDGDQHDALDLGIQ